MKPSSIKRKRDTAYFYGEERGEMKKNKRKMTPYERKMLLEGIGIFIIGLLSAPILRGLVCIFLLIEDLG